MSGRMDKSPRRLRRLVWFVGVAAIVSLAVVVLWRRSFSQPAHAVVVAPPPAVQVSVADAARRNVPIYLTGLGTVQASNMVALHAQVDGKLQEVLFTEGQMVHKGDILAKIDPRLYQAAFDQAKAKKAQDEALLVSAEKDLARFKGLALKGFETQQNIDQQQAKVDQLKAAIEADTAAIESAQTQLDYTTITAPIDGRIGVRLVDPGNIVHANDQGALATVTQTRPTAVLFTLPASWLDDVRAALKRGPVAVTAFDQDNRKQLATGQLLLIDNVIDQTTASIRLKAMFPNDDEVLWPGEFVNARLLLETRNDVLTIPPTAVQRGPNGVFTWLVTERGTVQMRPLKLGPTSGNDVIVEIWPRDRRPRRHRGAIQAAAEHSRRRYDAAAGAGAERDMNISEPFIHRPVATTLLMAALAFVGIVAYPFLPVAPLPQVDFPTIQVSVGLSGASAETMASSVAAPLERQFGQIAGVTQMTSTSVLGATTIVIQFDLNRNIDSAAQDVQAAITAAGKQLPQNLSAPPSYRKVNPADSPIMILAVRSDSLPLTTADDYADNILAQQISQIPGVALVSIAGEQKPAIRVQVDPGKLSATGLTLEDVRVALVQSTTNAAKGTLNGAKTTFTIAANDQLLAPEDYNNVIIAYRNGAPLRVRDVGNAVIGCDRQDRGGLQQQRAVGVTARFQAAGRQRHRHGRPDQGATAAADIHHSPVHQGGDRPRPHRHHPSIGARCRVHARPDDLSGRARHPALPAQFLGDAHPEHHGPAGARRLQRRHVSAGLQPR